MSNRPTALVVSSATAGATFPTSTALRRTRLRGTAGSVEVDVEVTEVVELASEASVDAFDTVRCRPRRSVGGAESLLEPPWTELVSEAPSV